MLEDKHLGPEKVEWGRLAKISPKVDEEILATMPHVDTDALYRVLWISKMKEGKGDIALIGPYDMKEDDVKDFRPELMEEDRYKNVRRIPLAYLRAAHN